MTAISVKVRVTDIFVTVRMTAISVTVRVTDISVTLSHILAFLDQKVSIFEESCCPS